MILTIFFFLTTIFFAATTAVSFYYIIKFSKIIFLFEDELSLALEVHDRSIATFDKILNYQVVMDSPYIRNLYVEILEDVKMCKAATLRVANSYNKLRKKQYVIEENTIIVKNNEENSEKG